MAGNEDTNWQPSRRRFLQGAGAAAVAGLSSGVAPSAANAESAVIGYHGGGSDTLRVGLVGCGGRGTNAAINALKADANTKLVAIGDAVRDRAKNALKVLSFEEVSDRVDVSEDRVFDGFDAYRNVIDSGVDVVILATPPHFRPRHLEYAVERGKHCFVEKPVAVDVTGIASIQKTCELARKKGLSIVSGLCWRYDVGVREIMKRIEEGAIGDIVAIESCYNSETLWHRGDKPEWSRMEYQIRNWLYYAWLSGDFITEQAIHSLDKTAWLLGDASPVRAMGLGGRQQRTDPKYGHVFDHFSVFYEYDTGQHVYFTCRQQDGCSMHVDELVHGTKGKARILEHEITGENPWKFSEKKPSMYQVEHDELFKSVRSGVPIDNSGYMINSTMIAILGRMAAYSGKTMTWDEALASGERLGPTEYTWGDVPEPGVAIPGAASRL